MGREVTLFEREFADYCGASYAVAVTSGTAALHVALLAAGVGPGDEVLAVANGDLSASLAILHTGGALKWVDVDERTFNMDPGVLGQLLNERTRAVIVAHMYGLPADMEAIQAQLERWPNVVLVEDGALAPGAEYHGRRVGSFGSYGCFSLACGKVLGVLGSGGAVTAQDEEAFRRLNHVRNYGRASSPYREVDPLEGRWPDETGAVVLGVNERLDTVQAAVARVKLKHLPQDLQKRRAIAALYGELLRDAPCTPQYVPPGYVSSYRVYAIRVAAHVRDRFVWEMRSAGIEVGTHYVPPDHLHPYFRQKGYREGHLPVTERVAAEVVCLPCHQYLTVEEVLEVAQKAREVLRQLPS